MATRSSSRVSLALGTLASGGGSPSDDSTSCEDIYSEGVESHTTCYVESGFCELSLADWFLIVHTIDPFDVPFRQVITTGNACVRRWFSR